MFSQQEIAIGFFYDEKSARAYADLIGEKAFVVEI